MREKIDIDGIRHSFSSNHLPVFSLAILFSNSDKMTDEEEIPCPRCGNTTDKDRCPECGTCLTCTL